MKGEEIEDKKITQEEQKDINWLPKSPGSTRSSRPYFLGPLFLSPSPSPTQTRPTQTGTREKDKQGKVRNQFM